MDTKRARTLGEIFVDERPAPDHAAATWFDSATRTSPPTTTPVPGTPLVVLFDDFAYRDSADSRLTERGWTIRSGAGAPGVPGATWSAAAVTFPMTGGSTVLQLESSTDGTESGTFQTEVFHRRKFREGTYASRIRFSDAPVYGPDGDHVVQTYFTISPLAYDLDPNYSELDFEYLPNGGWGEPANILYATSWETYSNEPWQAINIHTDVRASYAGWHDLAIQVVGGQVKYYVDDKLFADHSEPYYPEIPMSINFSQWFTSGGLLGNPAPRSYRMQVDYVYFAKDRVLSPAEITAQIASYRSAAITHIDTV